MSSAITVNVVHAAVTGAFATTAKGLLRNALRGGTLQKLLQFCLLLRNNRRSRHSLTQLKAAATEKKPPRWYMTFLSQFHALYCLLRRMALPYSNCGSGYNWGIMSCRAPCAHWCTYSHCNGYARSPVAEGGSRGGSGVVAIQGADCDRCVAWCAVGPV